jgi:hypothetical protein
MKTTHILIGLCLLALGIYIGAIIAKTNFQISSLTIQVSNVDDRLAVVEKAQAEHTERWRFLNRTVDFMRRLLPWV